jgi:hypothetical protein
MRCTKQNYPYPEVTPLAHALVRHAPNVSFGAPTGRT